MEQLLGAKHILQGRRALVNHSVRARVIAHIKQKDLKEIWGSAQDPPFSLKILNLMNVLAMSLSLFR